MNRDNHYEAAFEAFLRDRGAAVVPVDEAKRNQLDDENTKSPDFLVVGPGDVRLVADVKGRRFPGGTAAKPRMVWQNWCDQEDIDALDRWAARLGTGFRGVLAFVYHVLPRVALPADTPDLFTHRDRVYLARGVSAADYRAAMAPRSTRWGTVHLPAAAFREAVRPFSHFLTPATVEWKAARADAPARPDPTLFPS